LIDENKGNRERARELRYAAKNATLTREEAKP
jgi:hypothetical protein